MRNEIRRRLANEGVELEGCPLCDDEGAIEIDIVEFPDKAKTVRYPCACTTKEEGGR
jgi:hypothetical protein